MPVKWTAEADQTLLLTLLQCSEIKAPNEAIAEAWPKGSGEAPTPRAIGERIFRLRKKLKEANEECPGAPVGGNTVAKKNGANQANDPSTPSKKPKASKAKALPATKKEKVNPDEAKAEDNDGGDAENEAADTPVAKSTSTVSATPKKSKSKAAPAIKKEKAEVQAACSSPVEKEHNADDGAENPSTPAASTIAKKPKGKVATIEGNEPVTGSIEAAKDNAENGAAAASATSKKPKAKAAPAIKKEKTNIPAAHSSTDDIVDRAEDVLTTTGIVEPVTPKRKNRAFRCETPGGVLIDDSLEVTGVRSKAVGAPTTPEQPITMKIPSTPRDAAGAEATIKSENGLVKAELTPLSSKSAGRKRKVLVHGDTILKAENLETSVGYPDDGIAVCIPATKAKKPKREHGSSNLIDVLAGTVAEELSGDEA